MCPDKELLSAYSDGEVPSPWKERIAAHLEECGSCRALTDRYRGLGRILREASPSPEFEAAAFSRVRAAAFALPPPRSSLWKKRIRLPFAAAAALLFFGSGVALSLFTRAAPETESFALLRLKTENAADIKDMSELLKMLEADSGGLTITLPSARGFQSYGQPVFLRAKDFPHGKKP